MRGSTQREDEIGVGPAAVEVVRRFYQAVADGDLEAAGTRFGEHAVWGFRAGAR
jgi:ketosteroid isomerase-like protein